MTTKLITVGVIALVLSVGGVELLAGTRMEAACPVFLLAVMACIVALIPLSLAAVVRRRRAGFAGFSAAVFGCVWFILSFGPGGDRVISRTTTSDGTDMCVIQQFTGHWGESYQVGFYYRRPGQQWGSFYYDHEDTRWWLGSIRVAADGKRATIRRFLLPVAYFDIPTESFTSVRSSRTFSPAHTWMPPDWTPESELSRRLNHALQRL